MGSISSLRLHLWTGRWPSTTNTTAHSGRSPAAATLDVRRLRRRVGSLQPTTRLQGDRRHRLQRRCPTRVMRCIAQQHARSLLNSFELRTIAAGPERCGQRSDRDLLGSWFRHRFHGMVDHGKPVAPPLRVGGEKVRFANLAIVAQHGTPRLIGSDVRHDRYPAQDLSRHGRALRGAHSNALDRGQRLRHKRFESSIQL